MNLRKILLPGLMICLAHSSLAAELATDHQKYSYTVGRQIAQMLIAQEVGDLDMSAFSEGVDDFLKHKDPQLSQEQMKSALKQHYQDLQVAKEAQAKANAEKGDKYRAENAKNEAVKVLESGLQYEVLKPGEGESPKAEDRVEVHYKGSLIDGTEFDSSYARGAPLQFNLSGVVPGFREALEHMKPGGKWRVVMPPELAYGAKGAGKKIGPNETLVFEIEYLGLVQAPAAQK
ncbi:MAG: FKBP-type peptidyl-prolyl cis-trans isomerase [Candidatus Thiodiazotropha sp.]